MELHRYLLGESERYCERYPDDCRNGLTPQLEVASSRLQDPAFNRSRAVLPRSAALAKDILVQTAPNHKDAVRLSIRPGTQLRLESTLEIVVESDRVGYLTLLDIDAAGRLVQIFPNELSLRGGVPALISPGRTITLPGEHAGFQFQTTPPTGRGLLVAVVSDKSDRVAALTKRLHDALPDWSLAPVARSLAALRGVDTLTATTLLAELGDVSRFDSPRQLMGYLGLVPSEHSSGGRRRQGGITRTGNGHARRALVESAWSYRFPARRTAHLERKAAAASGEAKAIAWKAQRRLCGRYRRLIESGKNSKQANVAVARELSGFVWDIVRREMARIPPASGSPKADADATGIG
jgi:hypothetical protein